ncbi:hypothetical protein Tco_0271766 [Tanacetum coccineum]
MANPFPNDDANALVPNFNIEFVRNPGHAHFANNNNNNGWIEWDVPLGEMDEPIERQGALTRTMVEVSDIEATNSIAIRETHPRVTALEEQSQGYLDAVHAVDGGAPHCFWRRDFQDRLRGPSKFIFFLTYLVGKNLLYSTQTASAAAKIMPPKQMSQAAIAKLVSDEVAKALAADRVNLPTGTHNQLQLRTWQRWKVQAM